MNPAVPNKIINQKILVVDDNPASLYATVRILKASGFDIIEADTGMKALAAAEHVDIGLIVLDINLPDIDALEVCRRLRGTGLGLALARKFAILLGGNVAVESEPGKGSRFSVTLPMKLGMP